MLKILKVYTLLPADSSLTGAGSQPLQVCGTFDAKLQYKEQCCNQTIYVVAGLHKALLGLPAIEALKLVTSWILWRKKATKLSILNYLVV